MQNGYYLDQLFEDSKVATVKASGCKEYIGTTISMKNNEYTLEELQNYSSDNFNHARCIIDGKFVYAYNGSKLNILY